MQKLTSDLYDFVMSWDEDGGPIKTTLVHTENGNTITFLTANRSVPPDRILEHMYSLTDSQCHQWLDPVRAEEEKKEAKKAAQLQRQKLQEQATKEREEKAKKKEESRRKQLEALQRKQEAQSN